MCVVIKRHDGSLLVTARHPERGLHTADWQKGSVPLTEGKGEEDRCSGINSAHQHCGGGVILGLPSPRPLNLLQEEVITSCWLEMWKDSHPVAEGNWAVG